MSSHQLIESLYPFVKNLSNRNDPVYLRKRLAEIDLNNKVRSAVTLCKKNLGIKSTNLAHLSEEEKVGIESCIYKNYLEKQPDCFGQRDTIFIDLHNYN